MTFNSGSNVAVVFGGTSDSGTKLADTLTFNGSVWGNVSTSTAPSARTLSPLAYDAARSKVLLFGGQREAGDSQETWTFNGSNWTLETPSDNPMQRHGHALAYDAGRSAVVMFGGVSSFQDYDLYNSETWIWSGDWSRKEQLEPWPAPRQLMAMAYDSTRQVMVMFGGYNGNYSQYYNDTWEWNGTIWTEKHPATAPSGRASHSMVFDAALGKVVLFGGEDANSVLQDTWTWDGTAWVQQTPADSPAARKLHGMAYDSTRAATVLFGGTNGSSAYADTWKYAEAGNKFPAAVCLTDHLGKKTTLYRTAPEDADADAGKKQYVKYEGADPDMNLSGKYSPTLDYPSTGLRLMLRFNTCPYSGDVLCKNEWQKMSKTPRTHCGGAEFFNGNYSGGVYPGWTEAQLGLTVWLFKMMGVDRTAPDGQECWYLPFYATTISNTISPGVCSSTPAGDSNTINGTLTTKTSPSAQASETGFQPILALLYSGEAPSAADSFANPAAYAIVVDGQYTFLNVPSGEYHISFRAMDGFTFEPAYVSVTAISGGETTAPAVEATEIKYADAGCQKRAVWKGVASLSAKMQKLTDTLTGQIEYNQNSIKQDAPEKAREKFLRKLAKVQLQADKATEQLARALLATPLTVREGCPASNKCRAANLSRSIAVMQNAFKKMRQASLSVAAAGAKVLTKADAKRNGVYRKEANRQYVAASRVIAGLPTSNYLCPEK